MEIPENINVIESRTTWYWQSEEGILSCHLQYKLNIDIISQTFISKRNFI